MLSVTLIEDVRHIEANPKPAVLFEEVKIMRKAHVVLNSEWQKCVKSAGFLDHRVIRIYILDHYKSRSKAV
jgi:hypothetical protein